MNGYMYVPNFSLSLFAVLRATEPNIPKLSIPYSFACQALNMFSLSIISLRVTPASP